MRHVWTYDGCAKCASKARHEGNTMICPTCKKKPIQLSQSLRFTCTTVDETGSSSVIFWDKLASQLLEKSTTELKHILISDDREYDFPYQCDSVVGKRMLLKLKHNDFNAKHIGSSISVIQYTVCEDLADQFEEASPQLQQVANENQAQE